MSFLSPLFLLGALVAALPVALHLLGRRPQDRVVFPAVRLLKRAPAQEVRRRRLRELLLLALRVAAVVLLAVAFARPYFATAAPSAARSAIVVAIDRSFSMSAPGQFEHGLSEARDVVRRAAPGVSVALLAFDDDAQVVVKPTGDRAVVFKALAQLRPGYGGTSYAAVLARGAETLGAAGGQLVVVTDLQRGGWDRRDAAIPDRVDVTVRPVGGPASNVSVSNVRRSDGGAIAAIVHNSGTTRRTGRARLTVNGQARGAVPFAIDKDSAQEVVFPGVVPATGEAIVEVDDPTGYQADNRAYALLDPPQPPDLLAITGQGDPSSGSFYLQRALEVDGAHLFKLDSEPASRVPTDGVGAALRKYAGVVLLGTRGLAPAATRTLTAYVNGGGGLLVVLDDQVEASVLEELFGSRVAVGFENAPLDSGVGLVIAEARHPVLQSLGDGAFSGVRFARTARLDGRPGHVLARFSDGAPALVEDRHGQGRVLLFGSDLSNRWNDFPLHPAFLPFIHQVARYLVQDRLPTREFTVADVPPGLDRAPGVQRMVEPRLGAGGAPTGHPVANRVVVNLDQRESDVGRMTAGEFERAVLRHGEAVGGHGVVSGRQAEQQQGLWRVAIAFAIIALLAEGLLGMSPGRRTTGREA